MSNEEDNNSKKRIDFKITEEGQKTNYIKAMYREGDILYINVNYNSEKPFYPFHFNLAEVKKANNMSKDVRKKISEELAAQGVKKEDIILITGVVGYQIVSNFDKLNNRLEDNDPRTAVITNSAEAEIAALKATPGAQIQKIPAATTTAGVIIENDDREIFTSRKHSMDYVTVDGVILRTGYTEKHIWYLVCIRELVDNAVDFLHEHYRGSSNAAIIVEIFKDDKFFRLKVRNSNENNFAVFSDANLKAIFDYEGRYGSKQDVHVINRGMLGDALKQILAFGYVLLHADDENSSKTQFIDKQWKHPLIIRHNKIEHKYILEVDKANQSIYANQIAEREFTGIGTDTEIELVLPVIDEVKWRLNRVCITDFCKIYPIPTTDVSFKISIIDNSNYSNSDNSKSDDNEDAADIEDVTTNDNNSSNNNDDSNQLEAAVTKGILQAISLGPPKAKITIEFAALHPIGMEKWNKTDSIYSYYPEEISRRFFNVSPESRAKTTAYNIICKWREGTNVEKDEYNDISIEELVSLPKYELGKRVKKYSIQLKSALPYPPTKLILPYGNDRKRQQQRKSALIKRFRKVYYDLVKDNDNDRLKAPSYKVINGYFKNESIEFPFVFEILAVPFADALRASKRIEFMGAINYSILPKAHGSIFEGNYNELVHLYDRDTNEDIDIKDIFGVLEYYGFHEYQTDISKIPCFVFANLITPRRDPHGQDKSRMDTTPFIETIVQGVKKIASEIKSYRTLGYTFRKPQERFNAERHSSGKKSITDILTNYLIEEHGLPATTAHYNSDSEEE